MLITSHLREGGINLDDELRLAVLEFKHRYGSSISFIANKCGVTREHLSRWVNVSNYTISKDLKDKLKILLKGEMNYDNSKRS